MNLPIQSPSAIRYPAGRAARRGPGGVTAACSTWDEIGCCALVVGLTGACATIGTGVGIIACAAAIGGYIGSNCQGCTCGEPLVSTVCGWISIINQIAPGTITPPSWC